MGPGNCVSELMADACGSTSSTNGAALASSTNGG